MKMTRLLLCATLLLLPACNRHTSMDASQQRKPWVIRTDFSDDKQWLAVCDLVSAPQTIGGVSGKFYAYVTFVNEQANRDKGPYQLVSSLPDDYPFHFLFVVDQECLVNPEHPVLVVGFHPADHSDIESFGRPPRETPPSDIVTFRALPSQIQSIENNLSIANMDFEEFADSVDEDGVYRGIPR